MRLVKSKFLLIVFIFFSSELITLSQTSAESLEAAQTYGWGFDNFTDAIFPWDLYCHTFFGIPSDKDLSWVTATFDRAFFELAYETKLPTTGGGNCFGMSILSLMMNKYGGYLGYCAPPLSHGTATIAGGAPADPQLKRAINIMHGHQLGLACIQEYINQATSGHSQDASYGLTLAQQTLAKEGPFLVCITKGLLPTDGGHTIIGYKVTGGGSNYKIWVVDPNRIWAIDDADNRDWYDNTDNFVEITKPGAEWNWTFMMAGKQTAWPTNDDDTVPGGSLGEGHLVIMSVSTAGPTQRVPSSMGLSILSLITQIYIWGNDNKDYGYVFSVDNNGRFTGVNYPTFSNSEYFIPMPWLIKPNPYLEH